MLKWDGADKQRASAPRPYSPYSADSVHACSALMTAPTHGEMVRRAGIEPAASWFVAKRSVPLSYRRMPVRLDGSSFFSRLHARSLASYALSRFSMMAAALRLSNSARP